MEIDYSPFLNVLEDGSIWWPLDDAVKLGAGYLPIRDDDLNLIPVLRAPNNRVRTNERTLISEFGPAHYTEAHPRLLVRDDGRYVDAHEFLKWLYEHIAQRRSAIQFPDDLARAVRSAIRSPNTQTDFESLAIALEGHFDKKLDELPNALRERIQRDFFSLPWDDLSPDQRRHRTTQWDHQHDPAMESERQYWWNFYIRMDELKKQIETWTAIATPTAIDLAQKETRLAELQRDLANMEKEEDQPYRNPAESTDFGSDKNNPPTDTKFAEQLALDPKMQQSANEIDEDSSNSADYGASAKECAVFRAMKNLTADEMSITFVGDKPEFGIGANNMLEISARGEIKRVPLAALDLVDRRSGSLNSQCAILLGMTQKMKQIRTDNKFAAQMTRLRAVFRTHLGITKPFDNYRVGTGWEPRFKIEDKRGALEERAKLEAERYKTYSFEEMAECGTQFGNADQMLQPLDAENDNENDAASNWLKENDPDASA